MEEVKEIGQKIIDNRYQVSSGISKALDENYTLFLEESRLDDEEIVNWRATLLQYIGEAMVSLEAEAVVDQVRGWAKQTGEQAVQYGLKIDELLISVKSYRQAVWKVIDETIDKDTCKFEVFLKLESIIDTLLHEVSYILSETFVEFHNKTLQKANDAMLEVSTPVVTLSDQVAILPLIGELDTYRAKILLESALDKCSEMGNSDLLIDLSGVPIVDTAVGNELLQLANALQLIGVRPTFTGLRPEIAQTMVQLGVDFKQVSTAATLKQALSMRGMRVE